MSWADLLLAPGSAQERWKAIFDVVAETCCAAEQSDLEPWLDRGDHVLASAAWDLWQGYTADAPKATDYLFDWWENPRGGAGRAVLILDSLSVREFRIVMHAAAERGETLRAALVRGAEAPTDTESFAHRLGLSQRSQLKGSKYPAGFRLTTEGLYTDVTDGFDFGQLVSWLPPSRDVVLWHPWPDDLIHASADKSGAAKQIASVARATLTSDGFWNLLEALRQGRELLVMADHGYAISQRFVDLSGSLAEGLREHFGASRCRTLSDVSTIRRLTLVGRQPVVATIDTRAAVIGPWKWKVQGGFPHLTHGGLTLAEVCVPLMLFSAR